MNAGIFANFWDPLDIQGQENRLKFGGGGGGHACSGRPMRMMRSLPRLRRPRRRSSTACSWNWACALPMLAGLLFPPLAPSAYARTKPLFSPVSHVAGYSCAQQHPPINKVWDLLARDGLKISWDRHWAGILAAR